MLRTFRSACVWYGQACLKRETIEGEKRESEKERERSGNREFRRMINARDQEIGRPGDEERKIGRSAGQNIERWRDRDIKKPRGRATGRSVGREIETREDPKITRRRDR